MRFEFFHDALTEVPKLCVDGLMPGRGVHLSHWERNETPPRLKADTSTEIALNFVRDERHNPVAPGVTLVCNNHFDTDGALSVWAALQGESALEHRALLIAAAEAGDFSEFSSDDGVRVSLSLQGTADRPWPIAPGCDGDEARAYSLALPQIGRLLSDPGSFEALWRPSWDALMRCVESFESGRSTVQNDPDGRLSVVLLEPEILGNGRFHPTAGDVTSTAMAPRVRGEWVAISTPRAGGWTWRVERAFHSWADTVVRPRFARRPGAPAVARLSALEGSTSGTWRPGRGSLGCALSFVDDGGRPAISTLSPEAVSVALRGE